MGTAVDDRRYTVIVEFDPRDQVVRKRLIDRLARIDSKCSERSIDLHHGRLVVKRDASRDDARRLGRAIHPTGARCKYIRQPGLREDSKPAPPQPPPSQIICPNCRFEQPMALECRACGIIIAKARRQPVRAVPKRQVQPPDTELPPILSFDKAELLRRVRAVLPVWLHHRSLNPERFRIWWRRWVDRMLNCGIAFAAALILQAVLLHVFKILWFVYTSTVVGQYYNRQFPDEAAAIHQLLSIDLLPIIWDSAVMVLYVSLVLSLGARFLHLIRYFFDPLGLIGRLIVWWPVTAALAAWGLYLDYYLPNYPIAVVLTALPALCIIFSCLRMTRDCFPEIGTLLDLMARALWRGPDRPWATIKRKLRAFLQNG